MKKCIVFAVVLMLVAGLFTGMVSASKKEVYYYDCSSISDAPYGSWGWGDIKTEDGGITVGSGKENVFGLGSYGTFYVWTGKQIDTKAGKIVRNYNVSTGFYRVTFNAKGEKGKKVFFDFYDGRIGMNGSYTFKTDDWEQVEGPVMYCGLYAGDIPKRDPNRVNGLAFRIYISGAKDPLSALKVTFDDITIYECQGEDIPENRLEIMDKFIMPDFDAMFENVVSGETESPETETEVQTPSNPETETEVQTPSNPETTDNTAVIALGALSALSLVGLVATKKRSSF